MQRKSNPPFLNGVPEMLILKLLSRRPMYGYELVQAIRQATNEELQFGEGCVYPILHRLESQGLLKACARIGRWTSLTCVPCHAARQGPVD